jgi:hypothetical protein
VKNWDNLGQHPTPDLMTEFLTECHAAGVKAPSSYSNIAHRCFPYPRVSRTFSNPFALYFVGGWQETFTTGRVKGPLAGYDIRAAYGSAMSGPLPDPSTYRMVKHRVRVGKAGLYVVSGVPMAGRVPLPLEPGRYSVAALLPEEIDLYRLADVRVHYGITWRWTTRWQEELFALAQKVPSARKPILASAWAQTAGRFVETECVPGRKRWKLKNPFYNLPWAFTVVHRVHQKIFEQVDSAYHVFVDSIITDASRTVPVGDGPGEWKRVNDYPSGLVFEGPGIYRRPGGEWLKRAGVPGPRRSYQTGGVTLAV